MSQQLRALLHVIGLGGVALGTITYSKIWLQDWPEHQLDFVLLTVAAGLIASVANEFRFQRSRKGREQRRNELIKRIETLRLEIEHENGTAQALVDKAAAATDRDVIDKLSKKLDRQRHRIHKREVQRSRALTDKQYLTATLDTSWALKPTVVSRADRQSLLGGETDETGPDGGRGAAGDDPSSADPGTVLDAPEQPFIAFASTEKLTADKLRAASLTVLVVAFVAAVAFIDWLGYDDTTTMALRKLAAGIPLALLFGYLAREAAHHRRNQRWAFRIATQLQSFRTYGASFRPHEPMGDVARSFGASVYRVVTEADDRAGRGGSENAGIDTTTLAQVQALIAQIQALTTRPPT